MNVRLSPDSACQTTQQVAECCAICSGHVLEDEAQLYDAARLCDRPDSE
jgi:hypothetical protein